MNRSLTDVVKAMSDVQDGMAYTDGTDSQEQLREARDGSMYGEQTLATAATDDLIAELMARFPHAVFAGVHDDSASPRWQIKGSSLVLEGLGHNLAFRAASMLSATEKPCASP